MNPKRIYPALFLPVLLLAACGTDPQSVLTEPESRAQVIEALAIDPDMRREVIDRLMSGPAERAALFEAIIKNEEAAGTLVQEMMAEDRGKALVASRIASDMEMARTFMRMLMLTGVVGELMNQQQAEMLDLGDAYAHGNQKKTMADLKRIGRVVDAWARDRGGRYPICDNDEEVGACLTKRLPDGSLENLHLTDAWGHPFQYYSDPEGKRYNLISFSNDGQYDQLRMAGPTAGYDCDIVFSNGEFVQWPGRIRRESIRSASGRPPPAAPASASP